MYHAKNEGRNNYQFFVEGMKVSTRSTQLARRQAVRRPKAEKGRAVLAVTHPARQGAD